MPPTLVWNANTEPDLSYYNVYHGTITTVYYEHFQVFAPTTTYDIGPVMTNTELNNFFAVTAVDTSNNESGKSLEVVWANRSTTPRAISRKFLHFR